MRLDENGSDPRDTDAWPFEGWLIIAQTRFNWTPEIFWACSVSDWRALTRSLQPCFLTRAEFEALQSQFPDDKDMT